MIVQDTGGLGRVEVVTLPLSADYRVESATFLHTGHVLVTYHLAGDVATRDHYRLAVLNDDGSGWREIYAGVIPEHNKANGIRFMPFADNRRVLLGDYVLECSPSIVECDVATLVPVRYPWLLPLDPRIYKHWSEIIIAPDNAHMAWTMLRRDMGAAVVLGKLKRQRRRYVITRPQVISSSAFLGRDLQRPGFLRPLPVRGGEVKQFVRGGRAISLVGGKDGYVTDSVVQDLASAELTQITRSPGYDETTIFSPDERLGLVMSTRASAHTDPAILGLLPRPHGRLATQGLIMHLYLYAVAGVRAFRQGNIGPVLIDIARSLAEPDYRGVALHDPEGEWVYVSPMSWHPDGTRVMWLETLRASSGDPGGRLLRVRLALLHDYQPGPTVASVQTPDAVPYARRGLAGACSLWLPRRPITSGKIAGQVSGTLFVHRRDEPGTVTPNASVELRYEHFSDDGRTFFDGFERSSSSLNTGARYEAELTMSGEAQGEMKLRLAFSGLATGLPRLLFERGDDGQPLSCGYATCEGQTLRVKDLIE